MRPIDAGQRQNLAVYPAMPGEKFVERTRQLKRQVLALVAVLVMLIARQAPPKESATVRMVSPAWSRSCFNCRAASEISVIDRLAVVSSRPILCLPNSMDNAKRVCVT
jgi:hypothetical protein